MRDESNVDRAAQDHFNRAQIYALQFRPLNALPHYEKAYQYRPDTVEYAIRYGEILSSENEFDKAEAVFDGLLPKMRDLAAQGPAAHRPDLARTLNALGNTYDDTDRFGEAESTYKEVVAVERDLCMTACHNALRGSGPSQKPKRLCKESKPSDQPPRDSGKAK